MNLRFIVMITGYAENASTSCLIYQCGFFGHPGYASYKGAITNLALDLYAKFYNERLSIYEHRYSQAKECCTKSLIANKESKFCAECGRKLADKTFHPEAFMEYIISLNGCTCDSYGDAEYAGDRELTWWPYWITDFVGAPKEEVIVIAENAEAVLLAALLEAKPELKSPLTNDFELTDWDEFRNNIQPNYQ